MIEKQGPCTKWETQLASNAMGADYYKTLGIAKDATDAQIKSAYKKVSRRTPPRHTDTDPCRWRSSTTPTATTPPRPRARRSRRCRRPTRCCPIPTSAPSTTSTVRQGSRAAAEQGVALAHLEGSTRSEGEETTHPAGPVRHSRLAGCLGARAVSPPRTQKTSLPRSSAAAVGDRIPLLRWGEVTAHQEDSRGWAAHRGGSRGWEGWAVTAVTPSRAARLARSPSRLRSSSLSPSRCPSSTTAPPRSSRSPSSCATARVAPRSSPSPSSAGGRTVPRSNLPAQEARVLCVSLPSTFHL